MPHPVSKYKLKYDVDEQFIKVAVFDGKAFIKISSNSLLSD
jgi:hypothetical protein